MKNLFKNKALKTIGVILRSTGFYMLGLLAISFFTTSCASKRDWKESHYDNANSYVEAKMLCDSFQNEKARELGYECLPRDKNGRILRSESTANGNVSNIYINSSDPRYGTQNRSPSSAYQEFGAVFQNMYQMERENRMHRDKVRNGYYSKPVIVQGDNQ